MYKAFIDGQLLYSTAQYDNENIIINPTLNLEVNKAGQFTFTMPPDHVLYDSITKLKSVVTVEQDGEELFRGRVLNTETDFFNQKTVYCEGELCYFLDSLQPPCEFDGTAMAFLQQLIDNHNNAVDEKKQFTLGTVTAFDAEQTAQVEVAYYSGTLNELNTRMLGAYGGYFRIRHENGIRYLDYLANTDTNEQPIEFGVNLLDLQKNIQANDVFTVLIPLGASQQNKEGAPLDITSVNNGLNYIEDAEAVAKYGRIWRNQTWNYIDDPAKLLEKGRNFLATGILEETTLNIKAVDMHFVNPETSCIRVGDMVRIVSNPHSIERTIICYKQEIDLLTPENTQYTFGKPMETLTDNAVLAKKKLGGGGGGGGQTIEEEIKVWNTWADWFEEDSTAKFQITTGAINIMNGNSTGADIDLNGVVPLVKLSAHRQDIDTVTGRVDQAEASILVNSEGLKLKVDKNGVISAINQTAENITIQANKIDLFGYVTASELQATNASFANLTNGITTATVLSSTLCKATNTDFTHLSASGFNFASEIVSKRNISMGSITSVGKALTTGGELDLSHSHAVIVADDGTITLGEVSATGGNFKIADTKAYKDGVSAAYAEGWAAAVAMCSVEWTGTYKNKVTIKLPSETLDTAAEDLEYTITAGGKIDSIENTAANYFNTSGHAYAYVTDKDNVKVTVDSHYISKSQSINVGQ